MGPSTAVLSTPALRELGTSNMCKAHSNVASCTADMNLGAWHYIIGTRWLGVVVVEVADRCPRQDSQLQTNKPEDGGPVAFRTDRGPLQNS